MAFGATRADILGMVVSRALILGALGVLIGILASLLGVRLVSDLLFRVKAFDLSTFAIVTLVLLLVSAASALTPAVRAASVDPIRHLRDE
jgi:ABC-type antimicrobial peptide transport system permease subunit